MRSFRHRHRQLDPAAAAAPGSNPLGSGAVTIDAATVVASTIGVDSTHTSSIAGLTPPTATVTSSPTPSSSSTVLSTPTAAPANDGDKGSHTALSTGGIVGLAVGIFAVLAVMLVILMTIRQRRRLRARSNSGSSRPARKSWTRIDDPAPLQMRATNSTSAGGGDESFLSLNSTHGLLVQPPPPSRNPFVAQPPSQQVNSLVPQLPPIVRTAQDAHIPNPFTSPPASPSHSRSPSHASTYSSAHAPAPPALLSVPRAQTASVATSLSDYPYSLTDPEPGPSSRFSADPEPIAPSARLLRKPSSKAQDAHARARELRAMQDLISALDRRGAPPSAFPTIDTASASSGPSRLSRGEGVVTPGGFSPAKEESSAATHWTGHEEPLPPANFFRAALNMGDRDTGRH